MNYLETVVGQHHKIIKGRSSLHNSIVLVPRHTNFQEMHDDKERGTRRIIAEEHL